MDLNIKKRTKVHHDRHFQAVRQRKFAWCRNRRKIGSSYHSGVVEDPSLLGCLYPVDWLILVAVDASKGGRPFVFRDLKMKTLKQNPQTIDKNGEDIPEKATIRQYKKKGTLLAACEAYTCQSVYEDHALHYEISFSNNDVTCKILRTVY